MLSTGLVYGLFSKVFIAGAVRVVDEDPHCVSISTLLIVSESEL